MREYWLAAVLFVSGSALAGTPLPDGPHVQVSGTGKVTTRPDSALIKFEFEYREPRPLPAKQRVDGAVNRLLAGLGAFSIDDRDITASELSASEDIDFDDNGRKVSNGFVAERKVAVVLKDVSRLNELLDAGLGAGATGIGSVQFMSTREKALRDEAKHKAIESARDQAGEFASAFGGKLGPVYSINSSGSNSNYEYYGETTLDRIEVTGSKINTAGRYLQADVEYTESVRAVFELQR